MSDSSELGTAALVLGIIAAFAIMLYGDAGPTIPMITAPSFVNPVGQQYAYILLPVDDGTITSLSDPPQAAQSDGTTTGCTTASPPVSDWWGCVATEDGSATWDEIESSGDSGFSVFMGTTGNVASGMLLISIDITIQCQITDGPAVALSWGLSDGTN